MARKTLAALFYSVDGVATDPHTFQYDSFDAGLGDLMTRAISTIDDAILGRVTYEQWAGYWPEAVSDATWNADGDDDGDRTFADFINPLRKHVASRTLTQDALTWENSHLIEGDLLDYVRALKDTEGGDISVQGSLSVIRQLVEAGLLDELTLIVHPAIVGGQGVRLFDGVPATRLSLIDVQRTEACNVLATYGPRAD